MTNWRLVKPWSTCVLFRRSLRLELTSWAYPAININRCLQTLTKDISTPADIAPSALETIIFLLFYGLYKCTDLLLTITWCYCEPTRHGTGSLVTRSVSHLSHLSRPGHRVIILTRCETRVFSGFRKKCPKCKKYIWNAEMTSHCQVSVVGLKSLDVSPCNEVLLLPMIIKKSLAWE